MATNSRDKILDCLQDLILAQGFVGTSVDEVVECAGVSKGSCFYHFKSKEDAALAALDRFFAGMAQTIEASGFAERETPTDQLLAYLDVFAQLSRTERMQKGCLVGSMALELSGSHDLIREHVAGCFDKWAERLTVLIDSALPNSREAAGDLANHFISLVEGALLLAKAKQQPELVAKSILQFRDYVTYLIQPQSN